MSVEQHYEEILNLLRGGGLLVDTNVKEYLSRINNDRADELKEVLLRGKNDFISRLAEDNPKAEPKDYNLSLSMQYWGSTALGFDDAWGGSTITISPTMVYYPRSTDTLTECYIYFGGRFAYKVDYCQKLILDVCHNNVASTSQRKRYESD